MLFHVNKTMKFIEIVKKYISDELTWQTLKLCSQTSPHSWQHTNLQIASISITDNISTSAVHLI